MTPDELRTIAARAELCAEATIPGEQLRALVARALFAERQAKESARLQEQMRSTEGGGTP